MESAAEGMLGNDGMIKTAADGFVCAQAVALRTSDDRHSVSPTQSASAGSDIDVTLENESVWSRFHSLGTEMILTAQGRRMFPCCRFRLSGLQPDLSYFLIMDIAPLDDFRHRWNGKTWEPDGAGEPHLQSPVCFHPDSPAPGQRWMDGPVSFYKVKLSHGSLERDDAVVLHPMHRYQPRLYVVPVSACPDRTVPLDGPDVHMFTFPKTEFYAVTSYQNPMITRLKIDCNPFMLAFREDGASARLIQNKLKLTLSGRSPTPADRHTADREKHCSSTHTPHESEAGEEGILSDRKRASSDESGGTQQLESVPAEPTAQRSSESSEADRSPISPSVGPHATEAKPGVPSRGPARSAGCGVKRVYRRGWRSGARKAKSKCWSNVKYHRSAAVSSAAAVPDASMRPDLEDVDGVLFVSFTAKEALDVHVGNTRRSEEPPSPSSHAPTQAQNPPRDAGAGLPSADWICEQELVLLQHLKKLKNRQIIHPVLQQVGMKLNLLDPAAPIDLHYLGVALPLPSPVLTPASICQRVQNYSNERSFGFPRAGKTSDLTRIKGWMEKFNSKGTVDSSANQSAFSSVMLDEYLESEGQRISERADVFSASAPSPVFYQLPDKSSSYVRTLDSVLQTRSSPPNPAPSALRDNHTKKWRTRRRVRAAPETIVRSSSARLRWKRSASEDHHHHHRRPVASSGSGEVYFRRKRRYRRRKRTLRFNRDAVDGSSSPTSAQKHTELLVQEEHAASRGQSPTHVTAERAGFALTSLLTAEKVMKNEKAVFGAREVSEGVCVRDFCRLGCVCDSLNREPRGSTHCRRVQCMFSCSCFKHKILLVRSPQTGHEHNARSLMAFPVADPGSDGRPEPALRISSLWRRRAGENDPEPLFAPKASGAPRRALRYYAPAPRPCPQVQETEKDPVYMYLESMMTCARVREYNSNPPPQVHLLPASRSVSAPDETTSSVSQLRLTASQNPDESCKTREPEPTKVLEIISGCNWETHRSLVLKELFRCVSMNLLSPAFYIDVYKVELISKELKKDETGSTLSYKVCVSLGQTPEKTREPGQNVKKRESHLRSSSCQKINKLNVNENRHIKETNTPDETQEKHFPLLSRVVPAGHLKADKKTLVRSGPIKVNGKTYAQAKLILGRMGALHPANRLAAYVTGRIKPLPQNTSRSLSKTIPSVRETRWSNSAHLIDPSKHKVSHANQNKTAFKMPIPRFPVIPRSPNGVRRTLSSALPNPAAPNPSSLRNPGRVPNAVAPPVSGADTILPASALPPGQQVILQPVAGMTGVNMCQFNGQMIQLVPITPAVPVQLQTSAGTGSAQQEPQTAQITTSTLLQQNPAASQTSSSKPLPFIVPRIHAVPGKTVFTLGSPVAPGLQNGLLGKTGMFSFRICPPSAESKTVSVEQTGNALESAGTASTLLLPGGYRLIKLPMFVNAGVSGPATSAAAECTEKSAEKSKESETTQENSTSCSPADETLQSSVSIKTEPDEDLLSDDAAPVIVKVESCSDSLQTDAGRCGSGSDQPEPEKNSVRIKIEPCDDTDQTRQTDDNQNPKNSGDSSLHVKTEDPGDETITNVNHPETNRSSDRSSSVTDAQQHVREREEMTDTTRVGAGFSCSLFEGRNSSVFAQQSFTAPSEHAHDSAGTRAEHRPEENQNNIEWLWRRKRQASDDPRADSDAEFNESSSAFMYSSDGWTTEDSNDWCSEDDVDIEAFEEYDEKMNISLLRAKARRKKQQADQCQWLLKCKSAAEAAHRPVRFMSDLPLYKRTWRLNQTLRERKQQVELLQSLDSLKRVLGIEEDVTMSTQDLLREARQMIGSLEQHGTSLMAKKRILIRQYSHYQTLISQRSGANVTGTELQQKTAAPSLPRSPSETSAHSPAVLKRRLPNVVLQSFTQTAPPRQ
ncbi:MAX gene-associated protein [Labeo rohita]|uniref:MAX gene-associated protein n=1 Tax=Labeo rohita TaxID=84645 RepID=UPI0021E1F764|nr:MAX gene-associated protein [Labeo rohita]